MNSTSFIKKFFLILVGILGEVSSLIFIYFIKYRTHNLSLDKINLFYSGNFLNLLLSSLIVLSLLINFFRIKKIKLVELQIYLNALFLSVLMLLILAILLARDFYVLGMLKTEVYEVEKVISVILWIVFFIIKLFSLNYLVLKIFGIKSGLVPKNLILISAVFALIISFAFMKIYFISKVGDEFYLHKGEKFNAIVVLGAAVWKGNIPSPIYERRLITAYNLLNKGFADKIILTGSNAPFEFSEAKVGAIYLRKMGVDSLKLEFEEKTTSTIEQIHFIKRELIEKRNYKKILVVSDGFHLPRVIEIAKFLNVELKVVRSQLKIEFINNIWYRIRESVLLAIFWLFAV
ncbi:MAG: YdcF family protein [Ignavibacteria bacterium]|nr:YdcF family protein [Ignavibacteria bacterium]